MHSSASGWAIFNCGIFLVKCGDLNFHYFNFRIEMDVHLENVDFIEKEVYAFGDITDLDLEMKIEKTSWNKKYQK